MEFVFVVPRAELFPESYPQGFVAFGPAFPSESFETAIARHGYFVERGHAERTPALKQVIPYSIVVREGEVLLLHRLAKGGEERLVDKLSIGVGGHINPEDAPAASSRGSEREPGSSRRAALDAGTRREIREELELSGDYSVRRIGILNDDSNPVGAVHVGLVQLVAVAGPVRVREEEVLRGRFASPAELSELLASGANFETWSARLVERLHDLLAESEQASEPERARSNQSALA